MRDYNGERTLAAMTKFVETDGEAAEPVPSVVSYNANTLIVPILKYMY